MQLQDFDEIQSSMERETHLWQNRNAKNMDLTLQTVRKLNNGIEIPILGLGTWLASGKVLENAIYSAVKMGYRHIDTAAFYGNEKIIGKAIKKCGVEREDLFITTKLWNDDHGYDNTLKAIDKSLSALKVDYIDLYLIHWPVSGQRVETWKAMEKILEDGKAKAIGVSNFMIHHLEELFAETEIVPAVNQVEFHPFLNQKDLLDFCEVKNIAMEAYSPLLRTKKLDDPLLTEIAPKYGKTTAQILIRWGLQHGLISIPKSTNEGRIQENADIFDFNLKAEDMAQLDSIDERIRIGAWDPTGDDWK